MHVKTHLVGLSVGIMTFFATCPPSAVAAVDIHVILNGTELSVESDVKILSNADGSEKTYPDGLKIKGINGNPARVEANSGTSDDVTDFLQLVDAEIRSDNVISTANPYVLEFWAELVTGPDTTPTRHYEVRLNNATFKRQGASSRYPGAEGNQVKLEAWVECPADTDVKIGDTYLAKTVTKSAYTFFSQPASLDTSVYSPQECDNLTGDRILKGKFHFSMVDTNDYINLGASGGAMVKFIPPPEPDGDGTEGDGYGSFREERISTDCTFKSEAHWFCRKWGWWCPLLCPTPGPKWHSKPFLLPKVDGADE